jgi:serine phosphatase RsbU (regulator of sigma subunit)
VPPEQSALHFLSFYRPAGAISGDFFNVVRLSETRIGLLICDVMGHDVRASLVTAMLRAMSEDFTVSADDPGALLAHINRSLTAIMKKAGTTLFATAFYLIADVAKGELICANAGHPSPLWVHRRDGEVGLLNRGRSGPALGLVADATFPTSRSSIRPGDFVMLFTDGLFEIENPRTSEAFSQQRLLEAARSRSSLPADKLLDGMMEEIRHFADEREFEDDVCVLGVEVNGDREESL